ncbi:hypothetical protein BDN70DRAFT_157817 [Pholiota conissans]|uniref:Heme haloperoxidase family profile domain-containing protein n=1 Tax=Pholiota conissans TaxID=109636 RepID=A0A9P5YZA9_9AGAR|nr:hypothetical protein BDN70DRAFT_157817 [Pholiota conissans]
MSSMPIQFSHIAKDHEYQRAPSGASRSPCPALNTLANHGFIRRAGSDLKFFDLLRAIVLVYNLSYPLSFLLTAGAFITCGKVSFNNGGAWSVPPRSESQFQTPESITRKTIVVLVTIANTLMRIIPSVRLNLDALSARGHFKITHDASFVHPNVKPSTSPDPSLLKNLLDYALQCKDVDGNPKAGLGLADLAMYHVMRCKASASLDNLHSQISLGECSLTWEMLSSSNSERRLDGVIPVSRLEQWFGEERLPDGWWDVNGVRPVRPVGVWRARRLANFIDTLGK